MAITIQKVNNIIWSREGSFGVTDRQHKGTGSEGEKHDKYHVTIVEHFGPEYPGVHLHTAVRKWCTQSPPLSHVCLWQGAPMYTLTPCFSRLTDQRLAITSPLMMMRWMAPFNGSITPELGLKMLGSLKKNILLYVKP